MRRRNCGWGCSGEGSGGCRGGVKAERSIRRRARAWPRGYRLSRATEEEDKRHEGRLCDRMACPSGPIPPLFFCHRTASPSPSPTFLSPSESPAALFTALTFFFSFFLSPHRRTRAWWRTVVALSASSHHAHSQRGVGRWRSGR